MFEMPFLFIELGEKVSVDGFASYRKAHNEYSTFLVSSFCNTERCLIHSCKFDSTVRVPPPRDESDAVPRAGVPSSESD
jgi:hypothetical protein